MPSTRDRVRAFSANKNEKTVCRALFTYTELVHISFPGFRLIVAARTKRAYVFTILNTRGRIIKRSSCEYAILILPRPTRKYTRANIVVKRLPYSLRIKVSKIFFLTGTTIGRGKGESGHKWYTRIRHGPTTA